MKKTRFNMYTSSFVLIFLMIFNVLNINLSYGDYLDINEEEKERRKEIERQQIRDYVVGVDLYVDSRNVYSDGKSSITVKIKNTGGENLRKNLITMTQIPEGITLVNNESPSRKLDNLYTGKELFINYDINVDKVDKEKTVPVSFEFTGKYGTDVDNYKDYKFSKTFYIKINKDNEKNYEYKPLVINNIKVDGVLKKGEVKKVTFSVYNPNKKAVDSVKISVIPEEGILNKTQNIFTENNFGSGVTKTFSVDLFAKEDAQRKNYPIKILVEPKNANVDENNKENQISESSQYTGIFFDSSKEGKVKNPQIIITDYSYGGKAVSPGGDFNLSMNFLNTSDEELNNIKISLSTSEGTFIALNTSSSFYLKKISPNGTFSKNIRFQVVPEATTKTIPINIDYSYEDEDKNLINAKDVISVPVMQKTLLSIDEIEKPREVMEGEFIPVTVKFYNLGKTVISNLKVSAKGDFTINGEGSYFVGNLEAGKDNSFTVNIMPNDSKTAKGSFVFDFEKADGKNEQIIKDFNFKVNYVPMPVEENMQEEEIPKKSNKKLFYILGGIAVLVIGFIIFRKKRNKKKLKELDLDE